MTSADVVIEFIKGRPLLELSMRCEMNNGYRAPELFSTVAYAIAFEAMSAGVTEEERTQLDRMRGLGAVDWNAVAKAFGWTSPYL